MKQRRLPKSMGACADLLFDVRTERLAADKHAAALKAEEERIKLHIIDNLKKDDTGAAGKHHRVQTVRKRKWVVNAEKWPKFHEWVKKNNRFDMLQKRLSDTAIKDFMESPRAKAPPGVEPYDYVDVSLTKI